MPAKLIRPTDVITLKTVPILIYAGPGAGKTSLAQTSDRPLTLDFDQGIHRSFNRQNSLQFDNWVDVVKLGADAMGGQAIPAGDYGEMVKLFRDCATLVIDTGGRALDTMIPSIIAESPKNSYAGSLSQPGWGALGNRFTVWMKTVRGWGKQVVMVCHEEENKDASGASKFVPDLPGKMAYKEIHKCFDLMGRIYYEGKNRYLDFSPSDIQVAKDSVGWGRLPLPDLAGRPNMLAELLADAKARLGHNAAASAAVAMQVDEWKAKLEACEGAGCLNKLILALTQAGIKEPAVRASIKALFTERAKALGCAWDGPKKVYVAQQPQDAREPGVEEEEAIPA